MIKLKISVQSRLSGFWVGILSFTAIDVKVQSGAKMLFSFSFQSLLLLPELFLKFGFLSI